MIEILKKEGVFTVEDIVVKYGVPPYKVQNALRYHRDQFVKEPIKNGKKGRPKFLYRYIGKRIRYGV